MPSLLQPSCQSLLVVPRNAGNDLGSATGFVVQLRSGPCLITNYHVVAGRRPDTNAVIHPSGLVPSELLIIHNQRGKIGQWVPRVEALYNSFGQPLWREHPRGRVVDCVALPLSQLNDVELYPYPMTGQVPILVMPADVVSVVGFPFGMTAGGALAIWATGFVASEPAIDWQNLPCFLIDCRSRSGQSGSPVIAHRNGGMVPTEDGGQSAFAGPVTRLLGVYSGRIHDQSDIGIVWKMDAIQSVLSAL